MGRFRIQVLRNNAWETVYTINKNEEFSVDSTTWTLLNLDILNNLITELK